MLVATGSIHFFEVTDGGNVVTTTIFQESTPKGMKAVHSRHVSLFGGTPIVSEYFGYCQVWGG